MKQNILGNTGIKVSEIGYGALPIGPLQANFPVDKAADVIRYSPYCPQFCIRLISQG